MPVLTALDPRLEPQLAARARAEQIAIVFTHWRATTASMVLGGLILTAVMWRVAPHGELAAWLGAILANQAWRYELARRYRIAAPVGRARERWGRAWAVGSTIAGSLWGLASLLWFIPDDPGHQALLIVCLFGVILGGLNLTTVLRASFYGFVLPAVLPLIVRVAAEGDQVHLFIAAVLLVVLVFVLRFGHGLNDLLSKSLAMRFENIDLIGELQEQTEAADRARAAAEAANRAKTQFLGAASHDLRQPLHAMGLFAATLSARLQDLETRKLVASINASVEALEELLSALLDTTKLDTGAVVPNRSAFALAPLLLRVEREFAPLAAAKGLRLAVVPTRAWVDSDPLLLERILDNLASNAIRYTARGGVVIGARRRDECIAIELWDSGVGIADAERERIFEEFYQIGNGERHSARGMGLGLAIVRRLATLLEHPVRVDSRLGRGSRFAIELPRAESAELACAPSLPAAPPNASPPLAGVRVAVIDDEQMVIDGMRALYAAWGAEVVSATTGSALLAAVSETGRCPDLIVADYRLAQGEVGTEVVARLRRELGAAVPTLLISGDPSAAALTAVHASRCEVMLKPVLPGELQARSTRLLACRAPRRPTEIGR